MKTQSFGVVFSYIALSHHLWASFIGVSAGVLRVSQEIPRDTPPSMAMLITQCWAADTNMRFDMNRVGQEQALLV